MFLTMKTFFLLLAFAGVLVGCGSDTQTRRAGGHVHVAPHGGVLVEIGNHEFNLEFVLEPDGRLSAYVLDAHAENFVRISAKTFEVMARAGGQEDLLVFEAVANPATGETVGNTSHFHARSDWLQNRKTFAGEVQEIIIRGRKFENVRFWFVRPGV